MQETPPLHRHTVDLCKVGRGFPARKFYDQKEGASMTRDYVKRRNEAYYIAGSRVPLHVIVHEYKSGKSVESIRESFPTLTLEQVHGALAFYHGNTAAVEAYIQENEQLWQQFRADNPTPSGLKEKLNRTRQHLSRRG
jgi:uncharacterized protein (DUF433 family)